MFERDRAPRLWGFPHHQSPLAGWYPTRARWIFIERLLPWRPGALSKLVPHALAASTATCFSSYLAK